MTLRTVKVVLPLREDDYSVLRETAEECNRVFNFFVGLSREHHSVSYPTLHKWGYEQAKEICPNLPTALLQSAAKSALGTVRSYNSNNKRREWKFDIVKKSLSIPYNVNTISRRGSLTTLSTVNKRIRVLHEIPSWFVERYGVDTNKPQSATLRISKGKVLLCLQYRINEADKREEGDVVGVDRGLYNLCSTSRGELLSSKRHILVKRKYQHQRKTLQQKGTKSARRKFRKVSGKEKRFMLDVNNCVTKHLADDASVSTYVLETLDHMSAHKGQARKKVRSWLSSWSYYQFEQLLKYKCEARGILVVYVDPRYTSQKCSCCGAVDKNARKKSRYVCSSCGAVLHADINAAINIRDNYVRSLKTEQAAVNQPNACKSDEISSIASFRSCT